MKNRIASIVIYPMFGSKGFSVDLMYRGKVLHDLMGEKNEIRGMIQISHYWAINRGFTNTKTVYRG